MQKITVKDFIKRAIEKHGNKFDYSLVKKINGQYTKIKIICDKHGITTQTPKSHLISKHGCSECGIEQANISKKMGLEEFLKRSKEIHGDKYDYSLVAGFNKTIDKVKIICNKTDIDGIKHGVFEITPSAHINRNGNLRGDRLGRGCTKCGIEERNASHRVTVKQFLKNAKKVHGNDYDYSLIKEIIRVKDLYPIICNIDKSHGVFYQNLDNHINKEQGCPICKNENMGKNRVMPFQEFLNRSNKIHNNKYDYSKFIYKNVDTPGIIICLRDGHGEFLKDPYHHINREQGCIVCSESTIENKAHRIFKKSRINFMRQKKYDDCRRKNKLSFDFLLKFKNKKVLLIELDGPHHFKPNQYNRMPMSSAIKAYENTKINDKIKNKYCRKNHIPLLRIKYTEFKNLENILKEEINNFKHNLPSKRLKYRKLPK